MKKNKICVYTCITGNYDDLHELQIKEPGIDYICFTNNKNIKSDTWKVIQIDEPNIDNHKLARKIKIIGHPYIEENYDISLWMDARIVFTTKISDFIDKFLKDQPMACCLHNSRNCIYEEAKACLRLKKDTKENILKIVNFLKEENYPKDNGLYETTILIRKVHDKKVKETMELWLKMIMDYCKRDQLSFNYCISKTGLKLDDININVWNNEYFTYIKHNYKTNIKDARIYFGNENINYDFDLDYVVDYKEKDNNYSFDIKIPVDTKEIKIDITNVPCIKYSNIEVKGTHVDNIVCLNSIEFKQTSVFFNEYSGVQLEGDFHKDETLTFSITIIKMTDNEIKELLESTSYDVIYYRKELARLNSEYRVRDNLLIRTLRVPKRVIKKIKKTVIPKVDRVKTITDNSLKLKSTNKKIAVQAHVFYTDLLDDIYQNVSVMPYKYDLLISTNTEAKKKEIEKYFNNKKMDNVEVKVYPNKGRDILPFIKQLKGRINDYDFVCHIHTKRSKYSDFGDTWRKYLYKNLFGSTNNIKSIFFELNKKNVGLIYPEIFEDIKKNMQIGGNKKNLDELCSRLNINNSFDNHFPAGSMFWAKKDVIKDLIENVNDSDFEEEKGQMDGTMAHTIERAIEVVAREKKYKVIQIKNNTK